MGIQPALYVKEPTNLDQKDFGDQYDIIKAVITVYSNHKSLNEDFILANLKPELLNNVIITYIKKQLNVMVALDNYLVYETDKFWLGNIRNLLLDDIIVIVNLSRADKGLVLDALIKYIIGQGQTQPLVPQEQQQGLIDKLKSGLGMGKKKEEV